MITENQKIDQYLFQEYFEAWKQFVVSQSTNELLPLKLNNYLKKLEGYKYDIFSEAKKILLVSTWKKAVIGSGSLIERVIKSIEISSNLIDWRDRENYVKTLLAISNKKKIVELEACLYNLYCTDRDSNTFEVMIRIFGGKYPLLAYLFFLKDMNKYTPISSKYFDPAFQKLGVKDFRTSHKCSWQNYSIFLGLLLQAKTLLEQTLDSKVTLLDAHTFVFMLQRQPIKENQQKIKEYKQLPATWREAVIKARVGQGQYRANLVQYWSGCAVTNCKAIQILRASHIKPWSKSRPREQLDHYNGLLLSPSLDAAFDAGLISFDDEGKIMISSQLAQTDAEALGINSNMKLNRIENNHKEYLHFHRKEQYKS